MKIHTQKKELRKKTRSELLTQLQSEVESQRQGTFSSAGSRDSNVKAKMLRRRMIARVLTLLNNEKKA